MAKGKSLKQLIYAAFKDDVAFSIRDMKKFLKDGGRLDTFQITTILDRLFINLAIELDENEIENPENILVRAEDYLEAAQGKFLEIPLFADVIEEPEEEPDINIREGFISIDGTEYGIVRSDDESVLSRAGIKRRGRTITSFSELEEYVSNVPTVYGIQFVYNAVGAIVGYRVWVSDKS